MTGLQKTAQDDLRRAIERIEKMEDERKEIAEDIKAEFGSLRSKGFDVAIVRKVLRLRKKSQSERDEQEAILTTYLGALGMLSNTPLGDWAAGQDDARPN